MCVIVFRASWTGEVKHKVDFPDVEWFANVLLHELKTWFFRKMGEIGSSSGEQVVDDNHTPAFGKQSIAEVRSQKARTTCNQSTPWAHAFLPFRRTDAGTPSGDVWGGRH